LYLTRRTSMATYVLLTSQSSKLSIQLIWRILLSFFLISWKNEIKCKVGQKTTIISQYIHISAQINKNTLFIHDYVGGIINTTSSELQINQKWWNTTNSPASERNKNDHSKPAHQFKNWLLYFSANCDTKNTIVADSDPVLERTEILKRKSTLHMYETIADQMSPLSMLSDFGNYRFITDLLPIPMLSSNGMELEKIIQSCINPRPLPI